MRLTQASDTGYFLITEDNKGKVTGQLIDTHPVTACAGDRGCAIHNKPSNHPLKNAPLNWRSDRHILERICKHGIGHPDADSAAWLQAQGRNYENIHGCDGCC